MDLNKTIIEPTPYGSVGIIWTLDSRRPKIIRVLISIPGLTAEDRLNGLYPDIRTSSCDEIDAVAAGINKLLHGGPADFSLDCVDFSLCTEFQKRVLLVEHRIPRSSVSTYRLIGAYLGKPNGARAVGNALANNPFPLIVPCHRAIRSDRFPGGYQGGLAMKRALLEAEGIAFDNAGRVTCPHFYYENNMG